MAKRKPLVFIGSSSESIHIARAVQLLLNERSRPRVWKDGTFRLSSTSVESLVKAAQDFDFAVLIFTPDDLVISRETQHRVPRDNLMFEAGLFMGLLGRNRVILMESRDPGMRLPTDLSGLTTARFSLEDGDLDISSAIAPCCTEISNHIAQEGPRRNSSSDPRFSCAICYRYAGSEVEFLLVKTTRNHWIFPKGIISMNETSEIAAVRYAEDEGGIVGRMDIANDIQLSQDRHE